MDSQGDVMTDAKSLLSEAEIVPLDEHEAAHRKLMDVLAGMTPQQKLQTLINAKILTEDGELTQPFAELATPVEPKPQWFHDDLGEMAFWDIFALMVGTWEGDKTNWRWSVVGRLVDVGLLAHGHVSTVEEAKAQAFEAAKKLTEGK